MKYNRNTALDYRDYFHGFIEKLDKDSMEREERFTRWLKESEARLAADRKEAEARQQAAEARLAADRKEAEARQQATETRLALERKETTERLERERKEAAERLERERKEFEIKFTAERKEAKSNKRWLVGNFIAILVLAATIFFAFING